MAATVLAFLLLGSAVGTPIEELFGVPGFDPQGQSGIFNECLSLATKNFTTTHGDTAVCPKKCLHCVEDPKYCPFQCRASDACGCFLELPDLVGAYQKCCNMFDVGMVRGSPQCKEGLTKMSSKVMRTFEYHCGKTTTTVAPGTCAKDTGGSCAWFPCDSSRNAVCDDLTYRCVCDKGACASEGGCAKQDDDGEVTSFAAMVEEIKLSASVKTFAPELAERVEKLKRVQSVGNAPQVGQAFIVGASAVVVVAAVFGAAFSLRTLRPRQKPLLAGEALG